MGTPGVRELRRAQLRSHVWRTAVGMFVERGFAAVSVAEIASGANVSKVTVFNYFAVKEDIVAGAVDEHVAAAAAAVRARRPGESVVAAVREQFLARLAARDPATGLTDDPTVRALYRLVEETPQLLARVLDSAARGQRELARALAEATGAPPDDVLPRLVAAQLTGVRSALVAENRRRVAGGCLADVWYPRARAGALAAFAMVERGLGDYGAR